MPRAAPSSKRRPRGPPPRRPARSPRKRKHTKAIKGCLPPRPQPPRRRAKSAPRNARTPTAPRRIEGDPMKSLALSVARAAVLLFLSWLMSAPLESWARAPLWVATGVALSSLLFGEVSFLPIVAGALSPLAPALLGGSLTWVLFAMSLVWLAPRWVLTRSREQLVMLVVLSIAVSAVVAKVVAPAWFGELPWRIAACLFASVGLGLSASLLPLGS